MSVCKFCGQTGKITKEHVIPQWMNVLKPSGVKVKTIGEHRKLRQWTTITNGVNVTARVICKQCNEGWMNDLEMEAKPIILQMMYGEEVHLSKDTQKILSEWVTKTAMVFEFTGDANHSLYFTNEERKEFYLSRKIPNGVAIYLACYNGNIAFSAKEENLNFSLSSENYLGYTCTHQFGCFVYQILAHRMNVSQIFVQAIGNFTNAEQQIAPTNNKIIWPPSEVFDDQGLEQYRKRWLVK